MHVNEAPTDPAARTPFECDDEPPPHVPRAEADPPDDDDASDEAGYGYGV